MKKAKCKIIFFGTPEFAVPTLKALINAPFCDVNLVVTQPDKPKGRHHSKLVASPVKEVSEEAGIEIVDSGKLAVNSSINLGILVAYGNIIPKKVTDSFPLGILNIHPSLLPKYRGPSPIQAVILNQDKETGITIIKLDSKMDHGPIVAHQAVALARTETAGELHDKLARIGAELLIKILPDYIAGRIKPEPQNDSKATYTEKLTKKDGKIDWSKSPEAIEAHIRAMNPWPGAWTPWKGKKLIIWKASIKEPRDPSRHGLAQDDVVIEEVQLEGKKRMPYKEFLKGHR